MSTPHEDYLQMIAAAIREKEGSSDPIPAYEFADRIRNLTGGGGPLRFLGQTEAEFDGLSKATFSIERSLVNYVRILCLTVVCFGTEYTIYAWRNEYGDWYAQRVLEGVGSSEEMMSSCFTESLSPYGAGYTWNLVSLPPGGSAQLGSVYIYGTPPL